MKIIVYDEKLRLEKQQLNDKIVTKMGSQSAIKAFKIKRTESIFK